MIEKTVSLEINDAYKLLKNILVQKSSKIILEERLKNISVVHGSLNGVAPKSAKKVVRYDFSPLESKTKIVCRSSISSDWARLTLWGNIAAGVVAAVFWWAATEMEGFVANGVSGYWTWLVGAFGYPDVQYCIFMINVTKALSIFLVAAIVFEILDVFIVHRMIDSFAAETLEDFAQPPSARLSVA